MTPTYNECPNNLVLTMIRMRISRGKCERGFNIDESLVQTKPNPMNRHEDMKVEDLSAHQAHERRIFTTNTGFRNDALENKEQRRCSRKMERVFHRFTWAGNLLIYILPDIQKQ